MSGWANNDNYGQDPRFGTYYGQGYSGFGRQGYLGYYGGVDARRTPYPGDARGQSGYDGTDQEGYPFFGGGYGLPPHAGDQPSRGANRGPHAGKGPGRRDGAIDDEVRRRLTANSHLDASNVEVAVQNGEVTLTGTVESRLAKRTAEDIAESVPGVTDVHNRLTIARQRQTSSARSPAPAQQATGSETVATGRGRSRAQATEPEG